jgi:hypothetical protein
MNTADTPTTDFTAAADYLRGYAAADYAVRSDVQKPALLIDELTDGDGSIPMDRLRGALGRLLNKDQ